MWFPSPFFFPSSPPPQEAAVVFGIPRLCAPVLGRECQVSPHALVLPLLDVSGDVRLRPSLMGLQGDQTLFAKWGDLSPAAGRLEVLGGGAEVDERGSDQML